MKTLMDREPNNRFVATRFAATLNREDALRFGRLLMDRAPLSAFAEWPEFQEIASEEPTWETGRN